MNENVRAIKELARAVDGEAEAHATRDGEFWAIVCDDRDNLLAHIDEYGLPVPRWRESSDTLVAFWPNVPYEESDEIEED